MTLRRIASIAAATTALAALVACAPDSGTVTESYSTYWPATNKAAGGYTHWTYTVCVRGPDGKEGCDDVTDAVQRKCSKGARWPDCQRG